MSAVHPATVAVPFAFRACPTPGGGLMHFTL